MKYSSQGSGAFHTVGPIVDGITGRVGGRVLFGVGSDDVRSLSVGFPVATGDAEGVSVGSKVCGVIVGAPIALVQ